MNIEDDLRQMLRRKPAPPDLAAGVLERIRRGEAGPQTTGAAERQVKPGGAATGMRPARWLAAAAALALMASGGVRYYEQQQQAAEAERVRQEIRLALQITSEQLAIVQRAINEAQK